MKCEICEKEILRDSQCINYKYYHNNCIENLQEENEQLKIQISAREEVCNRLESNWNKLKEYLINDINYWQEQEKEWIKLGFMKFGGEANNKIIFKKVLDKMQELEQGSDSNEQNKNK